MLDNALSRRVGKAKRAHHHPPYGLPPSPILKQHPWLDRERLCDAGDVVDQHVAFGAFDGTDIGWVDPDFIGERLLTQAMRLAQRAHVFGQNAPRGALGARFQDTIMPVEEFEAAANT
jgi:hypothetical protein